MGNQIMKSFNSERKAYFTERARSHENQDRYTRGQFGPENVVEYEDFKGCSVGCIVADYYHSQGYTEFSESCVRGNVEGKMMRKFDDPHKIAAGVLGVPVELLDWVDTIFELSTFSETWTRRFLEAIPTDADLTHVCTVLRLKIFDAFAPRNATATAVRAKMIYVLANDGEQVPAYATDINRLNVTPLDNDIITLGRICSEFQYTTNIFTKPYSELTPPNVDTVGRKLLHILQNWNDQYKDWDFSRASD